MFDKPSTFYPHRRNKDGSYTSICLGCLAQVARKDSEAELAAHDNVHRCDPGRLAQRYFAEPPRLVRARLRF
jgi:hypothetical protein